MKLGVCYYPEHWPSDRWAIDAQQMREAGISIVRISEFAWALMEPSQGNYNWTWLDEVIQVLVSEGLEIVLCTPTAAPPAWLVLTNPDILPVDERGQRRRFGSRRHYCPNNPTFQHHTERIVKAMAKRYGDHPSVIGWQIDNEFACYLPYCYCENCQAAFQTWLINKYQTLDALNQAWGTIFWSQTYFQWEQIEPPNLTVAEPNPSHVLDYFRFFSDSWVAYQELQIINLRPVISGSQFITHNIIASLTDLDYHNLAANLDFISWDSYPTGYAETESQNLYAIGESPPAYDHDLGDPAITGFFHSLAYGLKQIPFWVMEQQTGGINLEHLNSGVRPGAVRLWTWHALACGAEAIIYFRWRASRFGFEQHHTGLRRHDGTPDIGYVDLLTMKDEIELMDKIQGEPITASIALVLDYNDLWAIQLQPHRQGFDYLRHLFVFYRACQRLGINVDLISPQVDLSQYKIIVIPTTFLGNDTLAERLAALAKQGRSILLGVRSGFKTPSNLVTDLPLPGVFKDLLGISVSQWFALPPEVSYDLRSSIPNMKGPASFWAESLTPSQGVIPLAEYTSGPFAGQACLTENPIGDGRALYLGWYPNLQQAEALLAQLTSQHGIETLIGLPPGLVIQQRGSNRILLNFSDQPQVIAVAGHSIKVNPRDIKIFPSL